MNAPVDQPVIQERSQRLSRYVRVLLVLLALYAAGVGALSWVSGSKVLFNESRAAPTLAIVHGIDIFQTSLKEASFNAIYGPLSYLVYLPIALCRTPKSFFLAGSMLSFVMYCAPLILFLWGMRARPVDRFWTGLLLAAVFLLVTVRSGSLIMSSFSISPDAAALGLAGAACTVLFFCSDTRSWLAPALMAACTCCAVFTKQNTVALVPVLLVFSLLIGGRGLALRLMVCMGGGVLVMLAVVLAVYHDLWGVYYNTVVVVKQQPLRWDRAPQAVRFLYEQGVWLFFAIGGLVFVSSTSSRAVAGFLNRRQWLRGLLFPCMALAFVPSSIGGMVFWGGWLNALSPALYFTLLTLLAFSYLLLVESPVESGAPVKAFGVLLVFAAIVSPLVAERVDRAAVRTMSLSDLVYRYSLQHPGEVYFPFHPTSVYLAEHKFYHSDWGLMNLIAGHFPVSKEDVLRNISPTAHLVAYPPDTPVRWLEPYLFPNHHVVQLSGLPGFNVFAIER